MVWHAFRIISWAILACYGWLGQGLPCADDALPAFGALLLANKVARARSDQSRIGRDVTAI
jgi:hypothetical protein